MENQEVETVPSEDVETIALESFDYDMVDTTEKSHAGLPQRMRIALTLLLVLVALVSMFPLRERFSSPDAYQGVIATLDTKKGNVMGMVVTCTAASAAISAIPGNVGTPIADKLMDLSSNLAIVLAVIYLEKYLLTIFGLATFALIVPICCALALVWVWCSGRRPLAAACGRLACKFVALGVVLMLTVPVSVQVTNMIDQTYTESLSIVEKAQTTEDESKEEEADGGFDPLKWLSDTAGAIQSGIESVTTGMLDQVNNLIEGLAVMIVTSCLIPIVVLVFFLWMAKLILGINIDAPMNALKARGNRLTARPQRGRIKAVSKVRE